jgi:alpha-tubulin suppressor-like RCC1 family protein
MRGFRYAGACALALLALATAAAPASATSYGAFGWGSDSYGGDIGNGSELTGIQCVNPSYQCESAPIAVLNLGEASGNSVKEMAGGYLRSMALLTNGTVMVWGSRTGETVVHEPVTESGLSEVTAIAGGSNFDLALLASGKVKAWGQNEDGQLGTGNTETSVAPAEVSGLTGVVAIAAGGYHSLALKSDGTVWAWGDGARGQLGNGASLNSDVPVEVQVTAKANLSEIVAIAAGGYGIDGEEHSLALTSGGTVYAWGDNTYGQLGDGKPASKKRAIALTGLGTVTAISAGGHHSMALLSSGKVLTWGWNGRDELGNGVPGTTLEQSNTPVEVSGLSEVKAIAAGESFDLVLLNDATLAAWGWNEYDELGDEAIDTPIEGTTESDLPVSVSKLHGVVGIAAASGHAFAVAPANALE